MEFIKTKQGKTPRNKMTINLGPQHPSTHGVLRLILDLDGEIITKCTPVIGYLHRGMEKMAQNRRFIQYLPVADRVDYLSGFFYAQAFCSGVEELLEVKIPEHAQYIRVLMMELNRITSHLLWLGTFMMDLGATGPIFYTFRERNIVLNLFEKLTGSRMMYNYFTFGGVKYDVTTEFLEDTKQFLSTFPSKINDYENIITENPIFLDRTKNIGVLNAKDALDYSITGVNLRASGCGMDFRRQKPYLIYDKLDFSIPTGVSGDSFERYKLRIEEMKTSMHIANRCIEWLSSNQNRDINLKIKNLGIKPKEGNTVTYTESPRGLVMCHIYTDGSEMPLRVKWRTPSFYAVQILEKLAVGNDLADLMPLFGSLDVVLPEVDR